MSRLSVVPDSDRIGSDEAVQEHRRIVEAFEARDGRRAESAVRRHIDGARRRMRRSAHEKLPGAAGGRP